MRKGIKTPQHIIDEIVKRANEGQDVAKIVVNLNCSERTVFKYLKLYGDPELRRRNRQPKEKGFEKLEEIIRLRKYGMTWEDIAESVGLSKYHLSILRRNYGLDGIQGFEDARRLNLKKESISQPNKNRQLCRKCKYRASNNTRPGCDYCCLTGKMRKSDVEVCDKYEKGPRLGRKQTKKLGMEGYGWQI